MTIGHIGSGSGNGLATSFLRLSKEAVDPLNAAYLIVKNFRRPLDLLSVAQSGQPLKFAFLSFSWAMISDIDFESEKYRYCGGFRFTFVAVLRICYPKTYRARLRFLVPKQVELKSDEEKDKK